MNRRRHEEPRCHAAAFTALILMVGVGAAGGTLHAIYRNGQVEAEREIARNRQDIQELLLEIKEIRFEEEALLDRYALRERLLALDHPLVSVSYGDTEKVHPPAGDPALPVALRP